MARRPALSIVQPPAPAPRPAVDLQEAAGILGLKDRSVRRLLSRGELEGYKPLPMKICIYLDSIETFQRARPQTGGGPVSAKPRPGRVDHSAHRQAVQWLKAHGML